MGGKGGSEMVLIPVRLTTDDYMDVGGRATHGAVAEASVKNGMKQLRRAHFHAQSTTAWMQEVEQRMEQLPRAPKGWQMPGAFSCFFFGHAKKKKSCFYFDSGRYGRQETFKAEPVKHI